jgi:hypothetical protein
MKYVKMLALSLLTTIEAFAYSKEGHELIGSVADERLSQKAKTYVNRTLEGLTLSEAARIPDEMKSWDETETQKNKWFHLKQKNIERQLHEFVAANPKSRSDSSDVANHHWFHYVDMPVVENQKYIVNSPGTSKWDIVHMMTYCIQVLRETRPEQNERKITKPVALILLAHYTGDIHQPLHVGAPYFSAEGKLIQPTKERPGYGVDGGNRIIAMVKGATGGSVRRPLTLHAYWDDNAVDEAKRIVKSEINEGTKRKSIREKEYVSYLASNEPRGWKMDRDIASLPIAWANEMQPQAVQAYNNLHIDVNINPKSKVIQTGVARDKPEVNYKQWSGNVTKENLGKAGWRLAYIIEEIVK